MQFRERPFAAALGDSVKYLRLMLVGYLQSAPPRATTRVPATHPHHTRPYKDYEETSPVVFVTGASVASHITDFAGEPGGSVYEDISTAVCVTLLTLMTFNQPIIR